ncbi:acyl-CoA synthetases (AMP-forming)/AMP-acid ligases II [Moorella thermoacetica Y72]|uniref:Acyl-CoA synthetases (AMP-forming)/AMP-acid ligases II n=1 Tax=Moorella thermoacetica Y72 TaxID=1325331 RepID=A0A0S6UAS1_NEOTH|nr:acyl-CoA synthetases (AMP-forming)/AMP-acid ligases II [Moorella thermoacetica Y72]
MAQAFFQIFQAPDFIGEKGFRDFYFDLQGIQGTLAVDDEEVVGFGPPHLQEDALHLGGEDIDPADDEHVVGTTGEAGYPRVGAAAGTGSGDQAGDIPGAVTDDRQGFLGEGGNHQFAPLARGQLLPGHRIDNFNQKVVGKDMETVFLLALNPHPGADNLAQAVDVDGADAQALLDLLAHAFRPGFGTEDPAAELYFLGFDPHLRHYFRDMQGIGRSTGQDGATIVLHDHYLALGVAAGNWNYGGPQAFGAVVDSQAAGKEAIPVGVLNDIMPGGAAADEGPGHEFGPDVDVVAGVTNHRRFTGSARGGVDTYDLAHGHGEHAVGVVIPQILFGGERQSLQVVQALDVPRFQADLLEGPAIKGDIKKGPPDCCLEAFQLEFLQFCLRHTFISLVPVQTCTPHYHHMDIDNSTPAREFLLKSRC